MAMNAQSRIKQTLGKSILTASLYKAKISEKNNQPLNDQIYYSLLYYEKTLKIAQASLKLLKVKEDRQRLKNAFESIVGYEKIILDEEQQKSLNKIDSRISKQLQQVIQDKIDNQDVQNLTFIEDLKEQFYEEEQILFEKVISLAGVLNYHTRKNILQGFSGLKESYQSTDADNKNKQILRQSKLRSVLVLFESKNKELQEFAFSKILLAVNKKGQKKPLGLQDKGKALLNLKQYTTFKLKSVIWRWYLNTTEQGQALFIKAANKLVLYANINKTTAFYRLMSDIKGRRRIPARAKRMATIVYVYTKLFFDRTKRDVFEKLRQNILDKRIQVAIKLIRKSRARMRNGLRMWYKNSIEEDQKKNQSIKLEELELWKKKRQFFEMLNKIGHGRLRQTFWLWKVNLNTLKKGELAKKRIMTKIMTTKAGRVYEAFQKIKSIPNDVKKKKWHRQANRFEKGLSNFINKTLKKSFEAFKDQWENAQAMKKRAVIQLMNCTMNKRKKMFNRWKTLSETIKVMEKCKKMTQIMISINYAIKSIADNAFSHNKDMIIKQRAINKIVKAFTGSLGNSFNKWRELNKIQKIRSSINTNNRKFIISMLQNLLRSNKNKKLKEIIAKFKVNRSIRTVQRNFLKRLLQSKAGMIMLAFREIKSLPERGSHKHDKKANRFEKGLSDFINRTLRRSFEAFKSQWEDAQVLKKRAAIQLINTTMAGRKKMFSRWIVLTERTKIIEKCKRMNQIMFSINLSIKSVTDNVFLSNRDESIKQKAINKIIRTFIGNLGDSFNRWRQLNKIETIRTKIHSENRKFIIKILRDILDNRLNKRLKEIIHIFKNKYQQEKRRKDIAKIIIKMARERMKNGLYLWRGYLTQSHEKDAVKRKIISKIMATKAGRLIAAFQKIKNIPDERIQKSWHKEANKFERGLSKFVNKSLKQSFDSFKLEWEDSQVIKKRAVIQLINCTISKRKKMFNRWVLLKERTKIMEKCKRMTQIMNQINLSIKSVADNAFISNKDHFLKERAISKIIKAFTGSLGDSFNKWRQLNRIEKLRSSINTNNRKFIINMLESLLRSNKNKKLKEIIAKFKVNRSIRTVQRNFLKRLLQSKAGMIMLAFREIKSLPERGSHKHDKKANRFEKSLSDFVNRTLRRSFQSFKSQWEDAQMLKKRAVIQLINTTMAGRKKMFNRWNQLNERTKIIQKCKRITQIMSFINLSIKSVTDNAFISNKDESIKLKAINKIIRTFMGNLGNTFNKWRQLNKIENIRSKLHSENKKFIIKMLKDILDNRLNKRLKEIIHIFKSKYDQEKRRKEIAKIIVRMARERMKNGLALWRGFLTKSQQKDAIKKKIMNKIMATKAGRLIAAFQKIKSIPDQRTGKSWHKEANRFERGLSKFVNKSLKQTFDAFKLQWEDAQVLKKRAVIQLINCTMSKRKKMFNRWILLKQRTKIMEKCKRLTQIMNQINLSIKSVADNAFISNKDHSLKEKAINKMIRAFTGSLGDSFTKWRQINRIEKLRSNININNRKFIIIMLENLLRNDKNKKLKEVIAKFKANRSIRAVQRNFLKRLLQSKAGMIMLAFRAIKSLPERSNHKYDKKANKFEKRLSDFVNRTLRRSFQSFKNQWEDAQVLKKRAAIQLINTTMAGRKKMFTRWRQFAQRTKIIQKCKRVTNIIIRLNGAIKSVTDNFFHSSFNLPKKFQIFSNIQALIQKRKKQAFHSLRISSANQHLNLHFDDNIHILTRNKIDNILSELYYKNVRIPAIPRKPYNLNQVQYIIKYILRLIQQRKDTFKLVFKTFNEIPQHSNRVNPWFRKSALVFSLNTKINVQKSFWRMISNSQTAGVAFNASVIVKLKKMYNNIKKTYILNMYHAFLMIDSKSNAVLRQQINPDSGDYEIESPRSRSHSNFSYVENSRKSIYYEEIIPQINSYSEVGFDASRQVSLNKMSRIFKKYLKLRFETWHNRALPEIKYHLLVSQARSQSTNTLNIARLGAVEAIAKISKKVIALMKQKCFDTILCQVSFIQNGIEREQNSNDINENLSRHEMLLDQIRYYKQQYEVIALELEDREKALKEADNMITILSLRNNYMITHKFLSSIEQVYYNVLERHLDSAFDAIMEEANRDFERADYISPNGSF